MIDKVRGGCSRAARNMLVGPGPLAACAATVRKTLDLYQTKIVLGVKTILRIQVQTRFAHHLAFHMMPYSILESPESLQTTRIVKIAIWGFFIF